MASSKHFEELEVWQLARKLNQQLYPVLLNLQASHNWELYKQLDRSAGSVMDNIAEGFERNGNREFKQFLAIAKGSIAEVRSQLIRILDRELISQEDFDKNSADCLLIANKIGKLMSYLRDSEMKGSKF